MIISTGMRTDIPAFYSEWFINRIKEGYVCTRNPFKNNIIYKFKLEPSVVDCLCFCTKNPIPMLKYIDELSKFNQFWFITITPYGKDIEPNVPDKDKIIEAFKQLSNMVGKDAIGWRYDPIFYSANWNKERHIKEFEKIAKKLKGYTSYCVISILDLYEKVKKNAPDLFPLSVNEQVELLEELVKIARNNGMTIKGCYEGNHLEKVGVDCSGCQTQEIIERAIGLSLNVPKKKNARGSCNCLLGNDIGLYNSCGHLCKYCYANANENMVLSNMKKHDKNSPLLIGRITPEDRIVDANQESYIDKRLRLF